MNTMTTSDGALDQSRRMAGQALERAGERMRELGTGMKDMASRSMSSVSDGAHLAQRRLGEYASTTGRYVTENPLKAALVAAAVGAIVAGAIIAMRRHRDSSEYL